MALPIIDVPKYTLEMFDGTTIHYRPFLVKEEKILLIALESKEVKEILMAIFRVLESCVDEKLDFTNMEMHNIWHILLHVRAKSKGEIADLTINCPNCKHPNEVSTDLTKARLHKTEHEIPSVVMINEKIGIQAKYPTMEAIMDIGDLSDIEVQFAMIESCISCIFEGDRTWTKKDYTDEEFTDFVESLNSDIFAKLKDYVDTMPVLKIDLDFKCLNCMKDQHMEVENFANFLS